MEFATTSLFALMQAAEAPRMTTGGWVFMIGAWAGIISLAVFCFSKVIRNRKK
jgi:hypothetical protein